LSAFRFANWIRGSRTGEPPQKPPPLEHVRILRSGVELERARAQALAFESAAAQALQERIDRYVGINAPLVVVPIPDNGTPSRSSSSEPAEQGRPKSPDPGRSNDVSGDGFFSPTTGVA
jgi:hypothetical protein